MKSSLITALVSATLITIGLVGIVYGIARQEKYECAKWAKESKIFGDVYYFADWQNKQCEKYDNN